MSVDVFRNALDVLIIGAGPAGLSAALALGRVLRSAAVFDSGEYRNAASSHAHTVPTHDHENPAAIRTQMKAELAAKYKTIAFPGTAAVSILESGRVFEVKDSEDQTWKGRKVILATGSCDVFPEIPGYAEAWGRGIFHCLFCHGFEEAGVENAAVLMTAGTDNDVDTAISNARLTRRFTSAVTILANGLPHLDSNDKLSAAKAHEYVVDGRAVKRLTNIGSFPTVKVEFVDGSEATFGFLVHRPSTKLRGSFAERLGLSTTPAGDISVINPFQESSRRGVFAAGDCATPLKQVAVAMAAGVTAGAGANVQIMQDDFEDGRW